MLCWLGHQGFCSYDLDQKADADMGWLVTLAVPLWCQGASAAPHPYFR